MNCPNCGHKIDEKRLSCVNVSKWKKAFSGICDQCKKLMHFIKNNGEYDQIKCYAWISDQEKKYARDLLRSPIKKYLIYIQPTDDIDLIQRKIKDFSLAHSDDFLLVFPSSLKKQLDQIECQKTEISDLLFPECPSYLAEKLIVENMNGELLSVGNTLFDRFKRI